MKRRTHVLYGPISDLLSLQRFLEENTTGQNECILEPFYQSRFQKWFVDLFQKDFLLPPQTIKGIIMETSFDVISPFEIEVSGFFQFEKKWLEKYRSEQTTVLVERTLPCVSGEISLDFRYEAFHLKNVELGFFEGKPVSAKIDMESDMTVVIYDLQAFEQWESFVVSDRHFVKLMELQTKSIAYDQSNLGELYAPCVDLVHETEDHLTKMVLNIPKSWKIIKSSTEAVLKLSESGIFSFSRSTARVMELGGAKCFKATGFESNILAIMTGMVVDIQYKDQLLFRGFVSSDVF